MMGFLNVMPQKLMLRSSAVLSIYSDFKHGHTHKTENCFVIVEREFRGAAKFL